MAEPREINYHNGEKLYNKEKVDELLELKQDKITPDTIVQDSDNLVENRAVKKYVDTNDEATLQAAKKYTDYRLAGYEPGEYEPGKEFGVKIGEIMDWPQFRLEVRHMVSDSPFEFTFNGQTHSVAVGQKDVELEIADNVPEGWRAMDGSVELDTATNPELAEFFGGRNTTTDGKIWIPYLPRKIIKIAY